MKRILIALILTVCLSSINLFARDIYRGDIQIQGGFGAESYKFATTVNSISSTTTADTFGFAYDITMHHLWFFTNMFGLGFFGDLKFQGGQTTSMESKSKLLSLTVPKDELDSSYSFNFAIGPTFAVQFNNIVRLNASTGISMIGAASYFSYKDTTNNNRQIKVKPSDITCYYLNIQGQFLPNKRVSPVAGYRLISGTSNDGFYWSGQGYAGGDKYYKGETTYTSNDFYAGVTINW